MSTALCPIGFFCEKSFPLGFYAGVFASEYRASKTPGDRGDRLIPEGAVLVAEGFSRKRQEEQLVRLDDRAGVRLETCDHTDVRTDAEHWLCDVRTDAERIVLKD